MPSIFKINHALCVDYMILRHAYIVKLMYTCYGMNEHAFNAMKLHDVMFSMMLEYNGPLCGHELILRMC